MKALVGAAEMKVVELEAPIGAEGEVGDDIIADAGTDTSEVRGFGLVGSAASDARETIVKEEEELEGIIKFLISSKGI